MSHKSSQGGGKKGIGTIIITFVAIVIVVIASLLGIGGNNEDAGNVQQPSESIVAESESNQLADEAVNSEEEGAVSEDESIVSEESEVIEEDTESEVSEEVSEQEVTVAEITFRNENLLDQHYEKHGIEMGFASAEEYELAAYKVIIHPDTLHKIEAEDGDDVYYLEATNEFVVVSQDGYIRTYFYPSAGIDYYNRQ